MQKIFVKFIIVGLFLNIVSINIFAANDTIVLTGTIRDFYDYSKNSSKNPDFENPNYPPPSGYGSYPVTGLVKKQLDSDKKPMLNSNTGQMGDTTHRSITDANSFSQWYRDIPNINESMEYSITLNKNNDDLYVYENSSFFPIDGRLLGNECERGIFIGVCKNNKAGYWTNDHNYHFTYEIHSQFTYQGGETFTFAGDDDVWVFINNKLVIDIGGIHGSVEKSVDLDTLGLTAGETYDFDFFFAERHITGSNFKITTSIELSSVDANTSMNIDVVSDYTNSGYQPNTVITPDQNDKIVLDAVLLNDSNTSISYHPKANNAIPMSVLFFAKDTNDDSAEPKLIRIDSQTAVRAEFTDGDKHAKTVAFDSAKLPSNQNDVYVKYLDYYDTNKVNMQACSGSSQSGNLKGLPQCVNSNNKYKELFGDVAYNRCKVNSTYGKPCKSNKHGVGNDPYDHEYGCYECTIDALNDTTTPFETTAKIIKIDLVSEYHFDECKYNGTNGEVKDEQNSVDAVAVNGLTTAANGKIRRSAYFNGKNYVDMGDSFNDLFGESNDKFTITAWIKPTKLTDDKTNHKTKNTFIAKASDRKNDNLEIGVNPDGSLHVYLDTKNRDKYSDIGSGITKDSWHFVSVSYDGNLLKVQIDDQKFESNVWNEGGKIDKAVGSPFTIGTTLHVDNYFKGYIDEVKIYNGVLTDDKLQSIYNNEKIDNGNDREADTCLMGEYRFDACDWFISAVKDSIGENDATASEGVISSENAIIEHSAKFNEASITAETDYTFVNRTFSISFWMKLNKLPEKQYMSVLSKDIELYVRKDGKLSVNLNNGSSKLVSSDSIKANEWKYITISSDSKVLKLFIDAKESGSIDAQDLGENGNSDLVLGKIDSNSFLSTATVEDFDGYIDELKIFDNILNESKIKKIIDLDNQGTNYDGTKREALVCLEPVGCTSKAIVIDDTKYVHQIDLVTGDKNTTIMSDEQINDVSVNGFGYNIKDGFLWGSSNRRYYGYLVKIGKDKNGEFAQTRVGPIEGLPTNKGTYIGDINNEGELYLYYKHTPKKGVHTMYVINLNREKPNYLKVIDSFTLPNIIVADMSFNPIDKQLYAIENDNDLYKIDVEKKTVKLIKKDAVDAETDTFGSSFFDSQGFFYAIKNRKRDIYRIDISDQNNIRSLIFSTLVNEDVQNVNIDGGRCNLKPIYIDYGDAPDSSSYSKGDGTGELNYKTLTSDDGPRHSLPVDENGSNVYFGDGVSAESDAKSSKYEDTHDYDDDDGLVDGLRPLYNSLHTYQVKVKVTNETNETANLVGWIDFNRNGRFETKEGVKDVINANSTQSVILKWNIPSDIDTGVTFARFRVTTDPLDVDESSSYGAKSDGEVEDYKITIKEGSFYDAWGIVEGSIDHPVIHTKIVKKTIALKTVSLNKERTQEVQHSFKDVKIGLFDNNGTIIGNYTDINTSSSNDIVYFNINKPYKYVYAHFTYKDEDNITHETNATDPFAIRPKNFVIKAKKDTNATFFRAGKEFKFQIKVEDFDDNYLNNFDLNSSAFELDYNETKENSGCIRGELEFNLTNIVNGEAEFNATYNEVGELNFKVKEVLGKEFAIVDKDDGSGDHRFIDEDKGSELFHPFSLKTIYKYNTINGKDYTYYSKDPTLMGVNLDLNVSVINENNETLKNFTDGCYNDDVNIRIDYQRWGNIDMPLFVNSSDGLDANVTNNGNSHAGAIHYAIDKSRFLNGKSSRSINMNFDRTVNIPKAPLKFKFTTTKTEIWPSTVSVDGTIDKAISFIYARAHAPKVQSTIGDTINAVVDYEVYLPVGVVGSDFGLPNGLVDSADDINWYKLPYDPVFGYKFGTAPKLRFVKGATIGAVTPTSISITADSTPYTNRIVYTPKDFLLYNRFNPMAKTDYFRINLNNINTTWNGKGKQGKTVDDQVSNRGLKKMDW